MWGQAGPPPWVLAATLDTGFRVPFCVWNLKFWKPRAKRKLCNYLTLAPEKEKVNFSL